MSAITTIGSDPAQVEYRLTGGHGCGGPSAAEGQFSYHADGGERPLRWIGSGLAAHGLVDGATFTDEDLDKARALMRGASPATGEQLVEPKVGIYADAKVSVAPLLAAGAAAVSAGAQIEQEQDRKLWARLTTAPSMQRRSATIRADEAGRVAAAFGLDADAVWGDGVFANAYANLTETVQREADGQVRDVVQPRRQVIGNAGYDATFTLPKSTSVLMAFADGEQAARVEDTLYEQVSRSMRWYEQTTAYAMRGKHGGVDKAGEPRRATVVKGDGFAGWVMVHRAARPTDGRMIGDPHWHAHVSIANMTKADGKYGTVAAGGRDLIRHLPAADALYQALVRREMATRFGVQYARSERTRQWEIVGIPDATIRLFSKRSDEVGVMLRSMGMDEQTVSAAAHRFAAQRSAAAKTDQAYATDATLQEAWQSEAQAAGHDTLQITHDAFSGEVSAEQQLRGSELLAYVIEQVTREDYGVTSHQRRFSRAELIAKVADALPGGVSSAQELEQMVTRVQQDPRLVAMPHPVEGHGSGEKVVRHGAHMANAETFTTGDVIAAERAVLAAAKDGSVVSRAVVERDTLQMAIGTVEALQDYALSTEQRDALEYITTSPRRVCAVQGAPGTGKTTLLRAMRVAMEAQGLTVRGAATAAVAAQNLRIESGIESSTVASLVFAATETGVNRLSGVDVLVIDEANLTEDRSRARIYQMAKEAGTRIVEVGDSHQLRGVGVGSMFAAVHAESGGPQLVDNRRQRREVERSAVAAWREGRHADAMASWAGQGRVVTHEEAIESRGAMLAQWNRQRAGAPSAYSELRGVLMIASTNVQIDALNRGAQAVRYAAGELGEGREYTTYGGTDPIMLHVGDQVAMRMNDWLERLSTGDPVLNGYRGVIDDLGEDGSVRVSWQQPADDGGMQTAHAVLAREYVEKDGLQLGYALTAHRAEGLTIKETWTAPDGEQRGGAVLVAAAGGDAATLHVATSRHRENVWIYSSRAEVEDLTRDHERGVPLTDEERIDRVIDAIADRAEASLERNNDVPVLQTTGEYAPSQYERAEMQPESGWQDLLDEIAPGLSGEAEWPKLQDTLTQLDAREIDVPGAVRAAADIKQLPEGRAAAVLRQRLIRQYPEAGVQRSQSAGGKTRRPKSERVSSRGPERSRGLQR
ncbi:conjugative relaxase-like TrwC/TraI family protein [Antricoccus suffuscus]|uniref:Conjugative relaxase-like TrwC/TraI family protein n=1 Tax=Antricoccus suffuscus TaxID=1629062 RepID=A0A2T0ZEN7_9ACTN|nr:MobF family relaxase [Antricoccus suffuscus]PRZ34820.1 conjugative relaxase-like TrwC/TraI family protein [Antricoccus suffuscus]